MVKESPTGKAWWTLWVMKIPVALKGAQAAPLADAPAPALPEAAPTPTAELPSAGNAKATMRAAPADRHGAEPESKPDAPPSSAVPAMVGQPRAGAQKPKLAPRKARRDFGF
jgi:hypothetical protein